MFWAAFKIPLCDTVSVLFGFVEFSKGSTTLRLASGLCNAIREVRARQLAKQSGNADLAARVTCDLAEFQQKYGGCVDRAEKLYREALEGRIRHLGIGHLDTSGALHQVGVTGGRLPGLRCDQ